MILAFISAKACSQSAPSTVTTQFKLYYGDTAVIGVWSQLSGPNKLFFDTNKDSVVNVSIKNPKAGTYAIQAISEKGVTTATINVSR